MNLNALPFVGWLLALVFNVSMAIPFWIVWTLCGVGQKYFYFVPEVYQSIGFFESVGLFTVIGILKPLLTPNLVSVTQKVTRGES